GSGQCTSRYAARSACGTARAAWNRASSVTAIISTEQVQLRFSYSGALRGGNASRKCAFFLFLTSACHLSAPPPSSLAVRGVRQRVRADRMAEPKAAESKYTMPDRTLFIDGVRVPRFLYGTAWKEGETRRLAGLALQLGFRGIDTA